MGQKIPKILVALDGSPGSEAVLPTVAELARAKGAKVCLLHVAPVVDAVIMDGRVIAYSDQETDRVAQEVLAYLKNVAAQLPGVGVELVVHFGDPAEEIAREAESGGADLIALATHHWTGVRRLLKGSVAEKVERTTAVPVLLVRYGVSLAA
ncbi:MAG: universal stress protein [Candidatus Rokubacteria bacterium]|nr:universal stress protein [Candidatus Rokubacteria bacterium]